MAWQSSILLMPISEGDWVGNRSKDAKFLVFYRAHVYSTSFWPWSMQYWRNSALWTATCDIISELISSTCNWKALLWACPYDEYWWIDGYDQINCINGLSGGLIEYEKCHYQKQSFGRDSSLGKISSNKFQNQSIWKIGNWTIWTQRDVREMDEAHHM